MKTIGEQVQEYRRLKGLTTGQLAAMVGKKRQHIEQLEQAGNRIPKYLGDLAGVMGTTTDEMLTLAGLAKPRARPAGAAQPKGAVFDAVSTEERELLAHWRHLLGKDRRQLLQQIADLAKEREAERDELFEAAGLKAIAERAAHATRATTAATSVEVADKLKQRELPLDDK